MITKNIIIDNFKTLLYAFVIAIIIRSLFIQPFYNFKHEWLLFPAIVDTDQHDVAVHFPGYTRSKEKTVIEEGQPLMQVIPFKRDEWKMSTKVIFMSHGWTYSA